MDMAGLGAGKKKYSLGFIHSYCCSEVWVGNDICGEWRLAKLFHAQKRFHYSDRTNSWETFHWSYLSRHNTIQTFLFSDPYK
jgi:hypothetical protein